MADTKELALDPKLVAEATRLGMNVSAEINDLLSQRIERRKRQIAWQEQNREAIEYWNKHVEENGLWYERIRGS